MLATRQFRSFRKYIVYWPNSSMNACPKTYINLFLPWMDVPKWPIPSNNGCPNRHISSINGCPWVTYISHPIMDVPKRLIPSNNGCLQTTYTIFEWMPNSDIFHLLVDVPKWHILNPWMDVPMQPNSSMDGCPKASSIEVTMYQNLIHRCSSALKVWGRPLCC